MAQVAAPGHAAPRGDAAKQRHRQAGSTTRKLQRRAPASRPHRPLCSAWLPAGTARSRKKGISASRVRRRPCARSPEPPLAKAPMPRRLSAMPPPRRQGSPEERQGLESASSGHTLHHWRATANHKPVTCGSVTRGKIVNRPQPDSNGAQKRRSHLSATAQVHRATFQSRTASSVLTCGDARASSG